MQGPDLVRLLQKGEANVVCLERFCQSLHSPGVIENSEELVRALYQPIHIEDGVILPAAFSDLNKNGLSTNRLAYMSIEEAISLAQRRVASHNKSKGFAPGGNGYRDALAYCIFQVSDLRKILSACGLRAYGVFDTAMEDDLSHADVIGLLSDKGLARSARHAVFQLAKKKLKFI